jgi:hypothetical protein
MARRLRIAFDRPEDFRSEFDRNIAKGGMLVPGASGLELREVVEVELEFAFCGERRTLEGEVVHVAPAGGVALQLLRTAAELRSDFAALLAAPGREAVPLELAELDGIEGLGSAEREISLDTTAAVFDTDLTDLEGDPFGAAAPAPTPPFERRGAARARARVPVRLDGTNAGIDGVTRDLSLTGALISADASELPPGKPVRLQLRNPATGDPLEVSGRVARHVETHGTVAAVSIAFDVPQRQTIALAALVEAAEQVHKQRTAAGISGRIEELGMPNLIQMLGRSSPHGTLSVARGTEEGVIAFEAGNLRYARLGATRSLKALSRLLQWEEGSFEFHAHVDALESEDEALPLEPALLEATRRIDEAARTGTPQLDPTARFQVDRAALSAAGALAKVEEAVLDLATAGLTVRRILDVIPEDDTEVSEALLALLERGVLLALP